MKLFKPKQKTDLLDIVNRSAKVAQMEGRNALGVAVHTEFTKEELAVFPEKVTPWVKVETDQTVHLFGFAHADRQDDIFTMSKKGNMVKGVVALVFKGDGSPWPEEGNQCIVDMSNLSPFDITKGNKRNEIIAGIIAQLSQPNWRTTRTPSPTTTGEK